MLARLTGPQVTCAKSDLLNLLYQPVSARHTNLRTPGTVRFANHQVWTSANLGMRLRAVWREKNKPF